MTDEQLIWEAEEDFLALTVEELQRLIALAKEGFEMKRRMQTLQVERDYLATVNGFYLREAAEMTDVSPTRMLAGGT